MDSMKIGYVSDHFTVAEMRCPTSGEIKFEEGFIDALEVLRQTYNKPMIVTSGCRSDAHNDWLKRRGYAASPNSFHLINNEKYGTDTCAVDISRPNALDLHVLLACATKLRWSIGIGDTFIHLDARALFTAQPVLVYTY